MMRRSKSAAPAPSRCAGSCPKRCIIEVGVRIGVQNLVRKLRRHGGIDREAGGAAVNDVANHAFEAIDVEGLGEYVLHHLADKRMTRSEEHTSEFQSRLHLVCRLLLA